MFNLLFIAGLRGRIACLELIIILNQVKNDDSFQLSPI